MKLAFARHGKQYFFITIGVIGREAILSRITDEDSRPVVSRLGGVVWAALSAIGAVWPEAMVSDFVIMPDHLHFLLIIDYDRDKMISPLYIAHRFCDAVEMAAAKMLERTGEIPEAPFAGKRAFAGEEEVTLAEFRKLSKEAKSEWRKRQQQRVDYMAGLLRGAIFAADADRLLQRSGGSIEAKSGIADAAHRAGESGGSSAAKAGVRGASGVSPVRCPIFERSPYIELSFDSRQLKAARHYMKLNPARKLWKRKHSDMFRCHRAIRSDKLADLGMNFDGLGNLMLLGSPFLFHVRLTLKKTVAEHEAAICEIVERAKHGGIPVSGFISPGEKAALARLKAEPRARFIRLLPFALPDRYDPSAEDSRELAAGRMAIVSPFADTPPISTLDMKRYPAAARKFRSNCLAMNDLAAKLCGAE